MKFLFLTLLLGLQAPLSACSTCFSTSPFHLGLVLGTLFLIPLPGAIIWGLVRLARKVEDGSGEGG